MNTARGFLSRIGSSLSTATAYLLSTSAVQLLSTFNVWSGASSPVPMGAHRGCSIRFVGTGVDNATAAYRVWARKRVAASGRGYAPDTRTSVYEYTLVGSGVVTLASGISIPQGSAGEETGGTVFPSGLLGADGLTFAASSAWTALVTALNPAAGTPVLQSPADNVNLAMLIVPDAFDAEDLIVDLDLDAGGGTAATGIGVLVDTLR